VRSIGPAPPAIPARRVRLAVVTVIAALLLGACGGHEVSNARKPAPKLTETRGLTAAQLAEARRLLDPDHEPKPPTAAQVACVARVVVLDPTVDEIANDMAQIENGDLRELVMTDYLHCAYDFVLDLYMRFAPSNLTPEQKSCVRSKFTQLTVQRLSEVMILDPDAGYTGPLTIHLCQTGSTANPLVHGTIPDMGSS
jgi:hypothetical protein